MAIHDALTKPNNDVLRLQHAVLARAGMAWFQEANEDLRKHLRNRK